MCTVENCDGSVYAFGLCNKHYQRFKKYGDVNGGLKNHAPPEERFWRFVVKTNDCWNWSGKKNNGYGVLSKGSKSDGYFLAHRFSWSMHNQEEILSGMVVMHKCDNPSCVNPEHLILGTSKDNTQDMIAKGRRNLKIPVGVKNGKSLLDEEKVRFIRASNLPHAVLARMLNVSSNCVRGVRIGRTWTHIPL